MNNKRLGLRKYIDKPKEESVKFLYEKILPILIIGSTAYINAFVQTIIEEVDTKTKNITTLNDQAEIENRKDKFLDQF